MWFSVSDVNENQHYWPNEFTIDETDRKDNPHGRAVHEKVVVGKYTKLVSYGSTDFDKSIPK